MRKFTSSSGDVLLDLNITISIEIDCIHKTKLGIALKYH